MLCLLSSSRSVNYDWITSPAFSIFYFVKMFVAVSKELFLAVSDYIYRMYQGMSSPLRAVGENNGLK